MDLVSLAGSLKNFVSTLSAFGLTAGGLAVTFILLLLLSRTSSAHPVLTLLWTRVFGKLIVHDAKIQRHVDELNNLSRFAFLTRIRSRTLHDAHALLDWCRHWNVATSQVHACGDYFDLDEPGLRNGKPPGKLATGAVLVGTVLMSVACVAAAALMFSSAALVTFKTSGDMLWLSETSAVRFASHRRERLEQRNCQLPISELSQRTGFADNDVVMLCAFFSGADGDPAQYVERLVQQNRIALAILALLVSPFALMAWRELLRAGAAMQLAGHIRRHEKKLSACAVSIAAADEADGAETDKGDGAAPGRLTEARE